MAEDRVRPLRRGGLARLPRRGDAGSRQEPTSALTAARHQLATSPGRLVGRQRRRRIPSSSGRGRRRRSPLHLDPQWSPAQGVLPPDMHGIVTSYQQVASSANALARLSAGAFSSSSTSSITRPTTAPGAPRSAPRSARPGGGSPCRGRRSARTPARSRSSSTAATGPCPTSSTGTPTRSPTAASCGRSTSRGRTAEMEWAAPDGSIHSATFDDPLAAARAGQRLRTALSLEGEWLPTVLGAAHAKLTEIRRMDPRRGARDRHRPGSTRAGDRVAAAVALRRRRPARHLRRPRRAGSDRRLRDDGRPVARRRADGLRGRRHPPAPGRRLCARATTTGALLPPGRRPLRALDARDAAAARLVLQPRRPAASASTPPPGSAELRRHSLRRDDRTAPDEIPERAESGEPEEQLSLFAVISAVATDAPGAVRERGRRRRERLRRAPRPDRDRADARGSAPPPLQGRSETLAPGDTQSTRAGGQEAASATRTPVPRARELLVRRLGLTHAQVNGEPNPPLRDQAHLGGDDRPARAAAGRRRGSGSSSPRWTDQTREPRDPCLISRMDAAPSTAVFAV